MGKQQKVYTREFKMEAVQLVKSSGKPMSQVVRELGISDSALYQWCKHLEKQGEQAFPGSGHQQEYPIKTMCRVLEVSVSGYFAWQKRAPSRRGPREYRVGERIVRLYHANRQVYGSPRMQAALRARSANRAGKSGWPGSCASVG